MSSNDEMSRREVEAMVRECQRINTIKAVTNSWEKPEVYEGKTDLRKYYPKR